MSAVAYQVTISRSAAILYKITLRMMIITETAF